MVKFISAKNPNYVWKHPKNFFCASKLYNLIFQIDKIFCQPLIFFKHPKPYTIKEVQEIVFFN